MTSSTRPNGADVPRAGQGTPILDRGDTALLGSIALVVAGAIAYGFAQDGIGLAAAIGVALLAVSGGVAFASRGGTTSQWLLPALGMGAVALLIHVARGRAEAHFAVFAFLAVTVVYRSWVPVISGAATIALHHLSFNFFQQWGWGPMCFTEPGLGRVIEHATYVIAESGVLVMLAMRARRDAQANDELLDLTSQLIQDDGRIRFVAADLQAQTEAARRLQEALRKVGAAMAGVRETASSIDVATGEIASGNADLSHRTELTASNLQQAASALAELTTTVNQTAHSARTANQLASSASGVAQRGGEVVSQVVATMEEISASSRRIADIIGTIDGIAFQTNILALNAAVEAARAGEQGRGFAVVASEVRSLAQRSAEAAREIKSLIGSSVEKVESGSRLVADAGSTMTEIVTSVQRVTDIIGEISAAAGEQSQGVHQVSQTVTQLDQATQQNAALVEQSAAAAESLKEQARLLGALVGAFDVGAATSTVAPSVIARQAIGLARRGSPDSVSNQAARTLDRTVAAPAAAREASGATTAHADNDNWHAI